MTCLTNPLHKALQGHTGLLQASGKAKKPLEVKNTNHAYKVAMKWLRDVSE